MSTSATSTPSPGRPSTEGLTANEAAERIELGRFGGWKAPTRLALNVERAYREFRSEAPDAPWDKPAIFDSMHHPAGTRGLPVEY